MAEWNEKRRLQHLLDTEGEEAMLRFAKQTLWIYVTAALENSKYWDSIQECVGTLELHGYRVDLRPTVTKEDDRG